MGDLPYFAAVIGPDPISFRQRLAPCALLYLAGRIIDDLIDRHYLYRGLRPTLLADLLESKACGNPDAMTFVTALLLCFESIGNLLASSRETSLEWASKVIKANRRALIGLMLEQTGRENWTPAYYDRLIQLKNVDYWRILYAALDPSFLSPLYPFLCAYYALAQKLNDVQGYARDESQGIPNLVSIYRMGDEDPLEAVEKTIGSDLVELGILAHALSEPERSVALVKLFESQQEAHRLGLLRPRDPEPERRDARLDLFWHSTLNDFVERLGPESLEDAACPVCGVAQFSYFCRAQGFALNRCQTCGHVFVNPRIRADIQRRLADELEIDFQDPFLESQRLGAEYLCRLLRKHAPGPRLLDIGFGGGYLMRMARAYAFQVYGLDSSATSMEHLAPLFGRRIKRVCLSDSELPWGAFDVSVMSHVLEHLAEPAKVLTRVRQAMNRRAILYVAVPDIESLQFCIFGNRWDAINPVAHYQFFSEASLTRLLEQCGFEVIRRIRHPPLRGRGQTRWMKLFRRLGGDESGELAMLARVPGDSYSPNSEKQLLAL
ncbi:MAG TPA: methyltransferase domain-containing protein [Bryobacteraceae bacterium]|nr:methyltransferase domain-containing protein [Bryobacteraceae bacterium]